MNFSCRGSSKDDEAERFQVEIDESLKNPYNNNQSNKIIQNCVS